MHSILLHLDITIIYCSMFSLDGKVFRYKLGILLDMVPSQSGKSMDLCLLIDGLSRKRPPPPHPSQRPTIYYRHAKKSRHQSIQKKKNLKPYSTPTSPLLAIPFPTFLLAGPSHASPCHPATIFLWLFHWFPVGPKNHGRFFAAWDVRIKMVTLWWWFETSKIEIFCLMKLPPPKKRSRECIEHLHDF